MNQAVEQIEKLLGLTPKWEARGKKGAHYFCNRYVLKYDGCHAEVYRGNDGWIWHVYKARSDNNYLLRNSLNKKTGCYFKNLQNAKSMVLQFIRNTS